LEWNADHIITRIDGNTVLEFKHDQDMFTKGKFDPKKYNPW